MQEFEIIVKGKNGDIEEFADNVEMTLEQIDDEYHDS